MPELTTEALKEQFIAQAAERLKKTNGESNGYDLFLNDCLNSLASGQRYAYAEIILDYLSASPKGVSLANASNPCSPLMLLKKLIDVIPVPGAASENLGYLLKQTLFHIGGLESDDNNIMTQLLELVEKCLSTYPKAGFHILTHASEAHRDLTIGKLIKTNDSDNFQKYLDILSEYAYVDINGTLDCLMEKNFMGVFPEDKFSILDRIGYGLPRAEVNMIRAKYLLFILCKVPQDSTQHVEIIKKCLPHQAMLVTFLSQSKDTDLLDKVVTNGTFLNKFFETRTGLSVVRLFSKDKNHSDAINKVNNRLVALSHAQQDQQGYEMRRKDPK